MVSYLLLVIVGVGIIITGFFFGIMSEVVGYITQTFYPLMNSLGIVLDDETTFIYNSLLAIFSSFLIIAGIVYLYYVFSMSQKPERPY